MFSNARAVPIAAGIVYITLNILYNFRAADIIPVIRIAVVQQEKLFVGTLPSAIERHNYTVSLAIVFDDNDGRFIFCWATNF